MIFDNLIGRSPYVSLGRINDASVASKVIADIKRSVVPAVRGSGVKFDRSSGDGTQSYTTFNGKVEVSFDIFIDLKPFHDMEERKEGSGQDAYDRAYNATVSKVEKAGYKIEQSGSAYIGDRSESYATWSITHISKEKYGQFTGINEAVSAINRNAPLGRILDECSVPYQSSAITFLSEEAKLQISDDVLTGMLRFITDKYNAIDFSEIEKSAGDIVKFKYTDMLLENCATLIDIYDASTDPGAAKYVEVAQAVDRVLRHLREHRTKYSDLYKSGNGVIQLLYTSLVAACIYSLGILVSNTIRFVTTEQSTECQVLFDEIPGTIKHVHIKNVVAAAHDLDTYEKLLQSYDSPKGKVMQESVTLASLAVGAAGVGIIVMMIPKIIVLIREIIYSVYFNRVKMSEMIGVQIDLINTNIESLERGRGNKKVIARQKKIVDKLTKWKNRFAVKADTVTSMVSVQKEKENRVLKVDRDSPIVQAPGTFDTGGLML